MEPTITINGVRLTEAQAIATRVAVTNFHAELNDPEFIADLGPIAEGYFARVGEVLRLMLAGS